MQIDGVENWNLAMQMFVCRMNDKLDFRLKFAGKKINLSACCVGGGGDNPSSA